VHVQTMSLTSFVSSHMVAIMAPARRSELSSHFFALLGVLLVDHHRVVSSKYVGCRAQATVKVLQILSCHGIIVGGLGCQGWQ
jgi:hypothetical protein